MKRHLLIVSLIITIVCSCGYAGDPTTTGGMSDDLLLTVTFEPKSRTSAEYFRIILLNRSANDLNIQVDPTNFHGSIFVIREGRAEIEYYEKRYLMLLQAAVWEEPVQTLEQGAAIIWGVPIAELRDVYGRQPTMQELNGATAYAILDSVAIVPPDGNYIVSNARQISAKTMINAEPARSRMYQTIGAYLDSIFFLGVGIFALLAPKRIVSQQMQDKVIVLE